MKTTYYTEFLIFVSIVGLMVGLCLYFFVSGVQGIIRTTGEFSLQEDVYQSKYEESVVKKLI